MNDTNLVPVILASKTLHSVHLEEICFKFIKQRINLKTVFFYFDLSNKYRLSSVRSFLLKFIGRCFEQIVKDEKFLKLEFDLVEDILSYAELDVTSEMQVFKAAISWINHDQQQRSDFAPELISTVRLPLLSQTVLRDLLEKENHFSKSRSCRRTIKRSIEKGDKNCQSRYCNDDDFYIYVCGSASTNHHCLPNKLTGKTHRIKANDPTKNQALPSMTKPRRDGTALTVEGNLYLLGGYDANDKPVSTVEVYLPAKNKWKQVFDIPNKRERFCACSFMGKIYIFGGIGESHNLFNYKRRCQIFDPVNKELSEGRKMKKYVVRSACAVYRDRIVVSGGFQSMRSCASYDPIAHEWTKFPSMVKKRYDHSSLVVRDKLYVIGGIKDSLEFYERINNCFTVVKKYPPCGLAEHSSVTRTLRLGNNILLFRGEVYSFDVDENEWKVFDRDCVTKKLQNFCCAIVPKF